MRRRTPRTFLALCLLVLFAWPVSSPRPTSERVLTMPRVDMLKGEREVARGDAEYTLAAWYEWAGSLPAPVKRLAREGNLRAQAQQDVDQNGVVGLIYEVFGDVGASAVRVARCESGLDPTARNRSGASGLFQVMLPTHAGRFEAHGWSAGDWADPYKNTVVAFDIYEESGSWAAWSCRWAA